MELVATTRRVRACEGEDTALLLLEYLIATKVPRECEGCAKLFGNNGTFNYDDPGNFFACLIRGSEA